MDELSDLPVFKAFNEIKCAFINSGNLVLQSPTGSGKSIGLPLLLLKENLVNGLILVVQPRRIAARLLARRVSEIIREKVGDTVGYQVRFEDQTSENTKIIYLTDGVLFRKILSDSILSRVGLVIFDEFHERSLQMDASLALLRDIQTIQRPSLKLIVTSATLSTEAIKQYLPHAKSIELSFRTYPVEIEYRTVQTGVSMWKQVTEVVKKCVTNYEGDILIFAPGVFEITKIIHEIQSLPWSKSLLVKPLYGEMKIEEQESALSKSALRKVIVSTNIAETSLTVEGVRIVIDTGIAKKSSFDPVRGVNVLLPCKISKSSADQRAGRAGRTSSGYCIRLWGEKEHKSREVEEKPAIKRLDLSEIYLNLSMLGKDIEQLIWLDDPSEQSLLLAKSSLCSIGALNTNYKITEKGRKICQFPLRPRLGMALLLAKELNCLPAFSLALALVEDRSPIIHREFNRQVLESFCSTISGKEMGSTLKSDLSMLLAVWLYAKEEGFSADRCKYVGVHALRCREAEKLATRFCRIAGLNEFNFEFPRMRDFARLILVAFPDHLARIKSRGTQMYESVNGYHLHLNKFSEVNCPEWVISLNLVEKSIKGKVGLEMEFVTELDEQVIEKVLSFEVKEKEEVILDPETRKVVQRTYKQIGKIKYNVKERVTVCREDMQRAYSTELSNGNLKLKKWDSRVDHFLSRILFLNSNYPEYELTPFDDDAKTLLFDEICKDSSSWKEIRNREVLPALFKLYSEEEIKILDSATPSTISLNNGKNFHRIEYDGKQAILRIKLQDLYDVKTHPSIVFDRHLITLHILAPNNRCVQITDKLNEFWEGSYLNVKKELAGRYPKHEWR